MKDVVSNDAPRGQVTLPPGARPGQLFDGPVPQTVAGEISRGLLSGVPAPDIVLLLGEEFWLMGWHGGVHLLGTPVAGVGSVEVLWNLLMDCLAGESAFFQSRSACVVCFGCLLVSAPCGTYLCSYMSWRYCGIYSWKVTSRWIARTLERNHFSRRRDF